MSTTNYMTQFQVQIAIFGNKIWMSSLLTMNIFVNASSLCFKVRDNNDPTISSAMTLATCSL